MQKNKPLPENSPKSKHIKQFSNVFSIPQHKSWNKYKSLYIDLRKNQVEWPKIEDAICKNVDHLCQGNFNKYMTINKCLPIILEGKYLIKNILTSRRIVFFQIIFCQGRLHEVETFLGYEEDEETSYENPYSIYHTAFKKYCCQLAIKPKRFCETGEGLLIEEKEWLIKNCSLNNLFFGFPILP